MLHDHSRFDVKVETQGRWRGILLALGVTEKQLSGKNTECPLCRNGPKSDRFRFDDRDGRGTWICSQCGAGDGCQLAMRLRGVDFKGVLPVLRELVGRAAFQPPKAKQDTAPQAREEMAALWKRATALDGQCLASRYLQARGIQSLPAASAVRFVDELAYVDGNFTRLIPAMIAKFVAPDGASAILHRTWLQEPGEKADIQHPRKMWRGTIPEGGAVRLGPAEEVLGIAEGIETALAASAIHRIPVWAALSANGITHWRPPASVKEVVVFGDKDESFTGEYAAYALAHRLKVLKYQVSVCIPDREDGDGNIDWNDVLLASIPKETLEALRNGA